MKRVPFYISLFMFAVIGMLAAIAAVYPADGVQVGEMTLNFPTLAEVFAADEEPQEPQLTPEELLALRAQEMRLEEEQQYLKFFRENPARLQLPVAVNDSLMTRDTLLTYLDPLFRAFEGADTTAVRVVHYGDSQIEEDRISNVLRRHLQEQFGGMGVGLLPLYQTVQSQTVAEQTSREPQRYFVYGNAALRREGSTRYGVMGQVAVLDSAMTVTVTARTKQTGVYSAHYFNQVRLVSSPAADRSISVNSKYGKRTIQPTRNALQIDRVATGDSLKSISLTLSGSGDLYGIMLDDTVGVNVDNIPLRGCSGTIFTGMSAAQLATYFHETNTRLIILQFGGNSMPYLKSEKQVDKYAATLLGQVRYLQAQAPDAMFVFIGPSDMTTRLQGKMQTYPILPYVDKVFARVMTEQAGIAYWSLFEAMGGTGSMSEWVRSGLAASDYIHFSRKGATEVGEMLTNALLATYRYYSWRREKNPPVVDLRTEKDTIQIEGVK